MIRHEKNKVKITNVEYLLFLVLFFIQTSLQAQINLVPNPSFEDTIACPSGLSFLSTTAETWNEIGLPNHFHSCVEDGGGAGVPDNTFGAQSSLTGNAYAGFTAYTTSIPSQRDYVTVELDNPLQPDTEYCVSFYVSLADLSYFAVENIGAYFSETAVPNNSGLPLGFIPQVENKEGILNDKENWTRISGTFTAEVAHEWLTIGNFYNNDNTNAENLAVGGETGFTELGFYYIDSVSVVALESVSVEMQGIDILTQPETAVLCIEDAQTLTAMGADSYRWFPLEDPFLTLSDADTLAFDAMQTQSFILETSNFDCVRTYIFTVEVRPEPQIDIDFEATCEGYNLLLSASGNNIVEEAIFEWIFYQDGNIVVIDSTKGGAEVFGMPIDSVILTINNLSNCSMSDTLVIDFKQNCQPCQDGFQNLVANPSMEYFYNCPNDLGEIQEVSQWQAPTNGSTDYLHTCANNVPSNLYGNQMPSNGEGYLGFFAYAANDYREYASIPILQPLVIGKNYCVRFDVSLADSSGLAVNSLGAHLSENSIEVNTQAPLFGFNPQVVYESDSSVVNKDNWTTLSGIYQASTPDAWLTIGNFNDNSNSETSDLDNSFLFDDSAYYYLDNVSVVELPDLAILDSNNDAFETPTVCVGTEVIAQAFGNYCNFAWIKADNPTDTLGIEASVLLNSNEAGLQNFVLLADFDGCTVTDTISINFEPFPEVSFELIPNCAGAVTILTNTSLSTIEGAVYTWDFGDGTGIEGLTSVANLYENPGSYTIQLTVSNPTGCEASAAEIYVIEDVCDPCNAENNFVSNPSFEEGLCPNELGQIDRSAFWFSPEIDDKASLFNTCVTDDLVGIPNNHFGSQAARTDSVYAGFKAYSLVTSDQQFITNRLGTNLEVGATYCASMFVNLADTSDFAISSFGFYFTVSNPTGANLEGVVPQIVNIEENIVADSLNWVEISGTFTANASYRFLTVGNFKQGLNLQEIQPIGEDFNPDGFAYYYLDDLSVVPMKISASEDVEICEGETVTLTGNTNTCESYWIDADKPLNVIATGNEITINPIVNSTYVFVGQNGNCSITESVDVFVKPLPVIDSISVNPNICKGENIQLLVDLVETGDYLIQWSPSESLVNPNTPNPITLADTTTTYFVDITNTVTNCSIRDSVNFIVNDLPIAAIDTDSLFICAGDSMRVNASGGDVFLWNPADAVSDPSIADPYVYSPEETFSLSVIVSNSLTGCSSESSLIVEAGKTYIGDTTSVSICEGDIYSVNDITLGLLNVPFDAVDYQWFPPTNLSSDSTRNTIISTSFDTVYTLSFTDKDGCKGNVFIEVDVNQIPNTGPDISICEGGSTQLNVSPGAAAYEWLPLDGLNDNEISNPIASPDSTTTYVVIATYINQSGTCITNDKITVFVNERGPSGTSGDATICKEDSIEINAFGGNLFEWTPTETLSDPTIANPTVFPEETTTYKVRIFNNTTKCESFDSLTISVKDQAQPIILSADSTMVCAEPLNPLEICLDLDYDGCEPLDFNVLTQLNSNIKQLNNNCFTYESAFAGIRSDTIQIQVCTQESLLCDTLTRILIHCDEAPQWSTNFIQRTACSQGLYRLQLPEASDPNGAEDSLLFSINTPPANGTATIEEGMILNYVSNPDFSGTEEFTVSVCDNLYPYDDCTDLLIRLIVSPNNAPLAVDLDLVIPYETQELICIEVQDADADPTSIEILAPPLNGSLSPGSPTCTFYTPNDNFYGQDTILFIACDNCNACDTATVAITIPSPSDPPIVSDTTVTSNYDTPISVCLDIEEPNGEPFDLTLLSTPNNGVVVIQNDSCVLYTPTSEFVYTENIEIAVCDSLENCTNITLTIDITEPINLAPTVSDTTASTISNQPVTFCFTPDDPEGDELTMSILVEPLEGDALIVSDSCIIYASDAGFYGLDSLQVQFCDPKGNCATAWGVISVVPGEDLPPVVNDTIITINSQQTTMNCLDIEELNGDNYSIAFEGIAPFPTVLDENCFEYTSQPNFFGEVSFTVNVCDENNNCTIITVTYIVVPAGNIAPEVVAISPIRLNLNATEEVCIEATDVNGDNLTYQLAGLSPNLGSVGSFNDNCFTFFAPTDGSGTVSVTINVCDDQDPQLCTPVVIDFQLNQAPNVVPEQNNIEVNQGESVTTCLTITEPDGDATTITVIENPNNGTASNSGNCITYTPTGNFSGTDDVTLEICDSLGACTSVTITFVVADVLTANNDNFAVEDNNDLIATFVENDNFTDENDLTINVISLPSNGILTLNDNNTFTYTPNANYVGSDDFVYEICLPNVGCEQATVTINVENLLEAIDDSETVLQNTPSIDIAILNNDTFPNVDDLDVEVIEGVSNGVLALNPITFVATYFPNAEFIGIDSFEYSIFYPGRGLETAKVFITVTKDLIPPVVVNDVSSTFEGEGVVISVLANDTGEGLVLNQIIDAPINGTTVINPDGTIIYTPNLGFIGIETFAYEVCTVDNLCATATVTIDVQQRDIVVCEIKIYAAMTPNGDGKNEVFTIHGLDCGGNDQNELIVFNRWGDEVFRAENYGPNNFWDGRYEGAGQPVPDGTYFYVLTIVGKDLVEKGYIEIQK